MTTLSTIGYGDFLPISVNEKIIVCFVMLIGVSVFTYIIGKFIKILEGYKELGVKRDNIELQSWIVLLTKSQHIPKHVLIQIENFFTFYWQEKAVRAACEHKVLIIQAFALRTGPHRGASSPLGFPNRLQHGA